MKTLYLYNRRFLNKNVLHEFHPLLQQISGFLFANDLSMSLHYQNYVHNLYTFLEKEQSFS